MKLGIDVLLWTDDACQEEFLPLFEMIKNIGYDGVELPIFSTDARQFEKFGRHLDAIGLERTGLTVRSSADDPMSPDPEVRARGVAATKAALDCCSAAGATHLVGPYHSALGAFSGRSATAEEWKTAVGRKLQITLPRRVLFSQLSTSTGSNATCSIAPKTRSAFFATSITRTAA